MTSSTVVKLFHLLSISILVDSNKIRFDKEGLRKSQKSLLDAFKVLRNEIFAKFRTKGYNIVSIVDPQRIAIHEEMITEIAKYSFNQEAINIADMDYTGSKKKYRFSLILLDNIEAFRPAKKLVNANKFVYSGLHVVILMNGNLKDAHEIFETFWSGNIKNVFILLNDNGTVVTTFNPYANPSKCGDTSPQIISQFINGKFTKPLIFWKKFWNMNKCPVTITTFTENVASFKETFANGSQVIRGYEYEIRHRRWFSSRPRILL